MYEPQNNTDNLKIENIQAITMPPNVLQQIIISCADELGYCSTTDSKETIHRLHTLANLLSFVQVESEHTIMQQFKFFQEIEDISKSIHKSIAEINSSPDKNDKLLWTTKEWVAAHIAGMAVGIAVVTVVLAILN